MQWLAPTLFPGLASPQLSLPRWQAVEGSGFICQQVCHPMLDLAQCCANASCTCVQYSYGQFSSHESVSGVFFLHTHSTLNLEPTSHQMQGRQHQRQRGKVLLAWYGRQSLGLEEDANHAIPTPMTSCACAPAEVQNLHFYPHRESCHSPSTSFIPPQATTLSFPKRGVRRAGHHCRMTF